MNIPIIWTEGIIAAGKTTFCREIAKRLEYKFLPEPVESNPYLEVFYKDPKRWAWPMQMHLLGHRFGMKKIADYTSATRLEKGVILDRSIAGDRVFCSLHHKAGNIHQLEFETYEYLYQILARDLQPPTVFLYLDVQPETAFKRMQKRNRGVENGVELNYLVKLREGYEELLKELSRGLCPWAHSVEPIRLIWDRDTLTSEEWDSVALTVRDACKE